ncbi:MAG TPA: DUF1376 domain-containing protein [Salinarimonas sp.]|nr:DUF1376 domain-containing protein [Salinarimonas sp.]
MPLFCAQYQQVTARLSEAHRGAYVDLLIAYWQSGPLPDDDEQLFRIARTTPQAWRKLRPQLAALFTVANGVWSDEWMDAEIARAQEKVAKKSGAGKAGANARWNGKRMTDALRRQRQTDAPSPSPKPSSSEANASAAGAAADPAKIMFASGKALLTKAGHPADRAGSMLGKWRKDFGDAALIAAIGAAVREDAENPVEFIAGCLRSYANGRPAKQNVVAEGLALVDRALGLD